MTNEQPDPASKSTRPPVPTEPTPAGPQPERLTWRVPGRAVLTKAVVAAALAVAAVTLAGDAPGIALIALAAVAVGLYALRDIVAPERLSADQDGVIVVTGFARRRRIPWRDIERIRVDERTRLGMRSVLLEIDTGDSLHLLGPSDLGAPVEDVVDTLRRLRTGR